MASRLQEFKDKIISKKVAVLGIGISHIPLIRYLSRLGVQVTAFDRADEKMLEQALEKLEGCLVEFSLGKDYLSGLKGFDIIFKTPGMRPDLPGILAEKARGAEITSEMEVFFALCPAQIFAVTGSDGKTTTTTLIHQMLSEAGYRCFLGGNIGTPLLDRIDEIIPTDKVILELSSFQLQTMKQSPSIAVITNLSPNHLDVHSSLQEYMDAKKNIFAYQSPSEKLVLNFDNEATKGFAQEAGSKISFFSRQAKISEGTFIKDGLIVSRHAGVESAVLKADEIILPGVHNIENYLAAIAAVEGFVAPETIQRVARSFKGVAHRIEPVRELDGVRYYNDSIASSPSRTIAGLNSFSQKVILIAGGKDKNIPYDDLGPVLSQKVKKLILIGQTADKIEEALKAEISRTGKGTDISVFRCGTYEEIVAKARQEAAPGDVVILSPASTSFDMFKNFEERGNCFKELVNRLE